jgi:hypothetical protein
LRISGLRRLWSTDSGRTVIAKTSRSWCLIISNTHLMASQEHACKYSSRRNFLLPVTVLSVSFTRRRKWKNKRSVHAAAMNDARIARRIRGQNYAMFVATVRAKITQMLQSR